jgi:hypothetical protein
MTAPQSWSRVRTIDLGDQQMLMLEDRAGARLQVLAGGIWLTEPDNWEDRFARSGEDVWLRSSGRVLVQAIGPSRLRLFDVVRRWPQALRSAWHRARHALLVPALAGTSAVIIGLGLLEFAAEGFLGESAVIAAQVLGGPAAVGSARPAGG